ncbi:MAG: hypothetical protein ACYDHM_03575 [Acidiferrobacterales bacterium]
MPNLADSVRRFDALNPINANAAIVDGTMSNGHACRLVDNTGEIDLRALEELLRALILEGRFGGAGLSPAGGNTVTIGAPQYGHVQVGEELYRLLVFPYEARIERF